MRLAFARPTSIRQLVSYARSMKYISGDELAEIIKSDKVAHQDYLVVDVRDDDYAGGNIKSALNLPSREFHHKGVHHIIENKPDVKVVVFHCALSQVRGPKAARIYEETRTNLEVGKNKPQEVYVLRNGFTEFQRKFKDDPLLVENWDAEVWVNAEDWS